MQDDLCPPPDLVSRVLLRASEAVLEARKVRSARAKRRARLRRPGKVVVMRPAFESSGSRLVPSTQISVKVDSPGWDSVEHGGAASSKDLRSTLGSKGSLSVLVKVSRANRLTVVGGTPQSEVIELAFSYDSNAVQPPYVVKNSADPRFPWTVDNFKVAEDLFLSAIRNRAGFS